MGTVDAYIASLPDGADRSELERLHAIVLRAVPNVEQGTSYGMACYLYRGKPVAALVQTKNHLAWHPYSGQVLREVPELADYDQSPGTLRFHPEDKLPEPIARALLAVRMRHIDEALASA